MERHPGLPLVAHFDFLLLFAACRSRKSSRNGYPPTNWFTETCRQAEARVIRSPRVR